MLPNNQKRYSVVEILYKEKNALINFAYSFLKNKELAEDVVHDVFVQLLTSNNNRLVSIYGIGNPQNYLKKIIAVRCLSKKSQFYRQNIIYIKNKIDVNENELEYFYNKFFDNNEQENKQLKKIKDILSTFDYYDKSLFLLYYESDMTHKELSEATGISKISIYNTVRKVKLKIKEKV